MVSFWIWTAVYFKNGHFGHYPTDEVEEIFSAWGNSRGILRKGPVVSHGASLPRGILPRFCPKPQRQNELPHWVEIYNLGEPKELLEPNRNIVSSRKNRFPLLCPPTFTSVVIICLDLSLCWKAGNMSYSSRCRPSVSWCLAQDGSVNVYWVITEKRRHAWKLGLKLTFVMKLPGYSEWNCWQRLVQNILKAHYPKF